MTDLHIAYEIVIDAPPDVVWRTITEPEHIAGWFADRVELDAVPGSAGRLEFDHEERPTHIERLVVETVEPPTRFSYRWGHPDGEQPVAGNSMLVEFTLVATGEGTRLRVVETGLDILARPGLDKAHYAEEHRNGWSFFIDRLGVLLGAGPPSP